MKTNQCKWTFPLLQHIFNRNEMGGRNDRDGAGSEFQVSCHLLTSIEQNAEGGPRAASFEAAQRTRKGLASAEGGGRRAKGAGWEAQGGD